MKWLNEVYVAVISKGNEWNDSEMNSNGIE